MKRALMMLGAVAMLSGCGEEAPAPPDPLADLGAGADTSRQGKADGAETIVFSSAMTTGPLLFEDFEGKEETERAPSTLLTLFDDRISPPSAAGAPWLYLRKMSAMGYYGPIGPYGPLGVLGPLGGNPWNADFFVSGGAGWADWSKDLDTDAGPLSADGPLGAKGPLNVDNWTPAADLGDANAFVSHLLPGGIFSVLGPVGVSGALGPLGPLGPVGAHGYTSENGGEYWPEEGEGCKNAPVGFEAPPCRMVEVEWEAGGERRVFELVEHYDEDKAAKMGDNDTSFMVTGEIRREGADPDAYQFTSNEEQWVTVMVVPEFAKFPFVQAMSILGESSLVGYQLPSAVAVPHIATGIPVPMAYDHRASFDDFDLDVDVVSGGKVVGTITSQSGDGVDWVQVRVPAGTQLEARVSLFREWDVNFFVDPFWGLSFRPAFPSYRLIVVGSTAQAQSAVPFKGPYLQTLEP